MVRLSQILKWKDGLALVNTNMKIGGGSGLILFFFLISFKIEGNDRWQL